MAYAGDDIGIRGEHEQRQGGAGCARGGGSRTPARRGRASDATLASAASVAPIGSGSGGVGVGVAPAGEACSWASELEPRDETVRQLASRETPRPLTEIEPRAQLAPRGARRQTEEQRQESPPSPYRPPISGGPRSGVNVIATIGHGKNDPGT